MVQTAFRVAASLSHGEFWSRKTPLSSECMGLAFGSPLASPGIRSTVSGFWPCDLAAARVGHPDGTRAGGKVAVVLGHVNVARHGHRAGIDPVHGVVVRRTARHPEVAPGDDDADRPAEGEPTRDARRLRVDAEEARRRRQPDPAGPAVTSTMRSLIGIAAARRRLFVSIFQRWATAGSSSAAASSPRSSPPARDAGANAPAAAAATRTTPRRGSRCACAAVRTLGASPRPPVCARQGRCGRGLCQQSALQVDGGAERASRRASASSPRSSTSLPSQPATASPTTSAKRGVSAAADSSPCARVKAV
jgi:hypothetical protein